MYVRFVKISNHKTPQLIKAAVIKIAPSYQSVVAKSNLFLGCKSVDYTVNTDDGLVSLRLIKITDSVRRTLLARVAECARNYKTSESVWERIYSAIYKGWQYVEVDLTLPGDNVREKCLDAAGSTGPVE